MHELHRLPGSLGSSHCPFTVVVLAQAVHSSSPVLRLVSSRSTLREIHCCSAAYTGMAPNKFGVRPRIGRKRRDVPQMPASMGTELECGAKLGDALLGLYGMRKLSAQDFCTLCFYCHLTGIVGANFDQLGYPPGKPTGWYQAHLDTVLPPPEPFYNVDTPVWEKGTGRSTRAIPTSFLPNRLQSEADTDPVMNALHTGDEVPDVMRTAACADHPVTTAARNSGEPLPVPLAFYLDGVAYTSALAGRQDGVLGMWGINLLTWCRHLIATVRKLDVCRCGCKGWCALYPLFHAIAWMFSMLQSGRSSLTKHDGRPWAPEETRGAVRTYTHRYILLWVKGDWDEQQKSLGLASCRSWINQCFLCTATQGEMHSLYRSCSLSSLPF